MGVRRYLDLEHPPGGYENTKINNSTSRIMHRMHHIGIMWEDQGTLMMAIQAINPPCHKMNPSIMALEEHLHLRGVETP